MSDLIKIKVRRIFAAVLALAFAVGVLPYNPLSGVFGFLAVTANAEEGEVAEIDVVAIMRLLTVREDTDVFPEAAESIGGGRVNARDVIALMRAMIGQE